MSLITMMNDALAKKSDPDMKKLGTMFVEMAYDIKVHKPLYYKTIKYELHKMAYGDHLTLDQANCWISSKTGAHAKWTVDQTEQVKKQHNLNYDCHDWYAVLNIVGNECPTMDLPNQVKLAKNWFTDECSIIKYFYFIHKK